MNELLATAIPCTLVVLSFVRLHSLLTSRMPHLQVATLSITAGVCALSLIWTAVAVNATWNTEAMTDAYLSAARTSGVVVGLAFLMMLYGPVLVSTLVTLSRGKKRR